MKREYRRSEPLFSQCGLNCGLCPMYHIREESHCPGCGGPGRPSCPILRCAGEHGGVEFCSLCPDWSCQRYVQEQADSFIPHRNARRDLETVKRVGLEQAFNYLYKDPEKNLRNIMDWADKFANGEFERQRATIRAATAVFSTTVTFTSFNPAR